MTGSSVQRTSKDRDDGRKKKRKEKTKRHFKGTKAKLKGDFCEDQRKQLETAEENTRECKPLLKRFGCRKKKVHSQVVQATVTVLWS